MKKYPEENEKPIFGAVYGTGILPTRHLKLLIPKGHSLNDRVIEEFGGDC